jgi:DNA-binding MarR family transcriptional regulator
MRLFRSLNASIRASQIEILLVVKLKPGLTQTELAIETNLTLAAISRAIDVLGGSGRRDGLSSSYGLIETRRNPSDDRILQVFLTPKGEQFVSLAEALTNGSSIQE